MEPWRSFTSVSIPKRVSEFLKLKHLASSRRQTAVSIPKRVSEFLKLRINNQLPSFVKVSIPKRVSEFLKLPGWKQPCMSISTFQSLKGFQSFWSNCEGFYSSSSSNVSIPKRVSEFLKHQTMEPRRSCTSVSIPKRVSEFLKRKDAKMKRELCILFQSLKGFQSFWSRQFR